MIDLTSLQKLNLKDPLQARRAWDTLHLVASVQGIVNRDSATLFVRFMPHPDDFWLAYLREPGNWLAGRPVIKLDTFQQLLRTFAPKLKGIVLYDEKVAATSNLASTIAGVEDRLCLRYQHHRRCRRSPLPSLRPGRRLRLQPGDVHGLAPSRRRKTLQRRWLAALHR
ncbi:MAG: hypothetical protein ACM359_09110 [Bacillota bacterium]